MSMHWVFNEVDDAVKARLEAYWAKELPRLQKLLVHYPTDLQEMRLTVSHHQPDALRSRYEVRGVIQLPTGTLVAEAEDDNPQVALDRVADKLVTEIRKHREQVRHDYVFNRKTRNRADLSAAGPLLQRDKEHGRREDFFRLLRPQLRFLRDYARREIRSLEQDGLLHRGEVTVDDLLDEVVARAWERLSDRPRHVSLDLWLTNLLEEILEEWIKQEPRKHASLEEKAGETGQDQVDEQEWWTELLGAEETVTVGDLIPDVEETDAWDQLGAEEQRDGLLSLMRELPPAQRQAFVLYALEDYNSAEIAMLQDRPESQVKADIEAARKTLRECLLAGGYVRGSGELTTASGTATATRGN
jgi:RNA polymerase sigma factor (sigma-70 family)